jgi:enoyl-CoA hydratase/carnithine racemase
LTVTLDPKNYNAIKIEKRDDGIAIATLNRPEKLNAMGGSMMVEYSRLPLDFDADPDVRALILTGSGRAFCAGGDFSPDRSIQKPAYANPMRLSRMMVDNMLDSEKPIIAAVNGYAFGLGATAALLCDVVIAARSATFGDTHVAMGLTAGDGGQLMWPLLIGPARAKYYMMTGERFDAEEAERIGLVNFVVDDDKLMDRAIEVATKLAAGPLYAIMTSKMGVNRLLKQASNLVMPLTLALEEISKAKDDHGEAVRAFQEKRKPRFTGT